MHVQQTIEGSENPFIPYGRQWIDEEDVEAVIDVLRSAWITQGPKVGEFEAAFASYVGSRFAVAVTSGTAALHLACLAAHLGPGDEVLTSPISFVATANCALYVGARPAFVDIDPMTLNLDPQKLEAYLEEKAPSKKNRKQNARHQPCPRAVIPVHFAGLPCDMAQIRRVAKKFNLVVIEDACHALGAEYNRDGNKELGEDPWTRVGSCIDSDMTVFSFHPVKHITTGEGGMVTTNDETLYERLLLFRNHGITRNPDEFTDCGSALIRGNCGRDIAKHNTIAWYYEMQNLGYNYRISDLQCALGLSQLQKIGSFIQRRRFIAEQYSDSLRRYPRLVPQKEMEGYKSSYHLYVMCVHAHARIGRNEVMDGLKHMGVGTQVHYIPIYQHPFYKKLGFADGNCLNAEKYFRHCLSIPIYPAMSEVDISRVLGALEVVGRIL